MTEIIQDLIARVERLEALLEEEPTIRFHRPTLEQVRAYAKEKKYHQFDADDFFGIKEGTGWRGVKSWQRTVDNWNRRGWCRKAEVYETKSVQEMFGV